MATKSGVIDAAPETATDDGGSLGLDGLTALMGAAPTPPPAEPDEEEPDPEPQDDPVDDPGEETDEPESILDRYGLSELTDAEKREINKELGGRSAERFAELTARREAAEAEAAKLRAELAKREPFKAKPSAQNPYRDKTSMEELEEIHAAAVETIRNGRALLDEHEDSHSDDEIGEFGGRQLTKKEVKAMVRRAEEAKDVFLVERANELRQIAGIERAREQNMEAVKTIHPWLADESSDLRREFELVAPKIVDIFRAHAPEFLPQIDLVLADHAAAHFERMAARKNPNAARKPLVATRKAPSSPSGAGSAPSRPTAGRQATRRAAEEQFAESRGGVDDLARLFMST